MIFFLKSFFIFRTFGPLNRRTFVSRLRYFQKYPAKQENKPAKKTMRCRIVTEDLTDRDISLVETARSMTKEMYNDEFRKVGCGILASDGGMYFGVSQYGVPIGYCAEPAARSAMLLRNRENKAMTIVALRGKTDPPSVIPPCGTCRDFLRFYEPNGHVIIQDPNHPSDPEKLKKIQIKYLLPFPYYSTRFPSLEKSATTSGTWCCIGHDAEDSSVK